MPGARVRVRFAGRLTDGFILAAEGDGSRTDLLDLRAVKGPAVVTPALAELAGRVAVRYVGTRQDVLRSAVPPRHKRAEDAVGVAWGGESSPRPVSPPIKAPQVADDFDGPTGTGWQAWSAALADLAAGNRIRGALALPTGVPSVDVMGQAVAATVTAGLRVLIVVPDARDVAAALTAVKSVVGADRCARLTADMGPAARYRTYLRALLGEVDVLVGTRAAAFTPLPELGLLLLWEDAEEVLSEPHAPYWHAREVMGMRAQIEDVSVLLAGRVRTPEVQRLVSIGWARELSPDRQVWRTSGALVRVPGEADQGRDSAALYARLPYLAIRTAREGLATGPVLVQVGRRGYSPMLACRSCRAVARCAQCGGGLRATSGHAIPSCVRCGRLAADWVCPECGGSHLRPLQAGSARTTEELRKAFPGVEVVTSDSEVGVIGAVDAQPRLVVATPGAEPVATGGYPVALLLDADQALARPRFRAAEEALLRWSTAAALVRPRSAGGQVTLVARAGAAPVRALVTADPIGWAQAEFALRSEAGLPPAVRMVSLTGEGDAASGFATDLRARCAAVGLEMPEPLGPVPLAEGRTRWLIRTTHQQASAVAAEMGALQAERSRARASVVAVRVDPLDID